MICTYCKEPTMGDNWVCDDCRDELAKAYGEDEEDMMLDDDDSFEPCDGCDTAGKCESKGCSKIIEGL